MIAIIARKEMTEMFRDGRFRWAAGIVLVLLIGSLTLGWQNYREVNAEHELARRATREQWLHQGVKNPHSAAHYGVYAFEPKLPLSLVDSGVDPWVGVAAFLEAHKQDEFLYRPAQDATAIQRFGELTGAAVLQLLMPLLIILLAFPAFSEERERGTLRQLLTQGIKPASLGLGKALGVSWAIGMLIIPAAILGTIALGLSAEAGAFQASLVRIMLLAVSYLLYFAAILALSLAVSAWARSSRTALITLLGFWMFNGLIAPRISADLSKSLYPTPSAFEFARNIEKALQNGLDGQETPETRAEQLRLATLKKYKISNVKDLPVSFQGLALQAGEEHGNEVFDYYHAALWNTFQQQNRVHQWCALIAPVLAMRSLSMGFAGTDFAQHTDFARAAENYRRMLLRKLNFDITNNGKVAPGGTYLRGDDLWKEIPDFNYQAPGVLWVLARQWPNLVLLSLWVVASTLLAWWAITHIQVN